jgi:antitoxin ParD1/3/4
VGSSAPTHRRCPAGFGCEEAHALHESLILQAFWAPTSILPPELERFGRACVENGRFNNVSDVVRSGLRILQEAEARRSAFVASLEAAREEGLREGFATI